MKRLTMIVALLLMLAMPMMAERVSPETARKVATTFLNNNGAKSAQLTDLTKIAGFPNLYIFNAEQGFVVMAADDCVQPILGYSLTGNFVAENMPTNVSGWLQGYSDEIQFAIDSKAKPSAKTSKLWKDLAESNAKAGKATVVVDALIQTTWDQDPGYNDLCPYDNNAGELTVTGCVATAMAQIMRYWEYPTHGTGSHSYTHPNYGVQSVNFAQQTYDWTDMPLHSPNNEIAKLMYHCGVSVDMDYDISGNGGSGAVTADVANALKNYFGYQQSIFRNKSNYNNNEWITLLKTELDNSRPLQYSGRGSGGGHSFVCDGYDNSNYFHFNWGWSGNNDGFYALTNLVPGSGGSGGGSYSFTQNQGAIFGIQPKACTASAPTNFSVTKDGRNAVLTWNAANNAVSYYIYRNDLLIASTSSTTYTDSNLSYGTYVYYVKSVDSNGAKSSPTSTITIAIEPVPSQLTVTKTNNNAILNWTEPEWCTPQNDNEVLTYSYGNTIYNFGSGGTMQLYYGHKYPASMINTNKVLYKVSFYPTMAGAFSLHVYTASAGNSKPQTQVYTQDITVSGTGWNDIVLNTPLQLDASNDLWVFIYDPEGKNYPMGAGSYEGTDSNGNYVSTSTPTSSVSVQEVVMLINTYITDGAFTYNLYDGTTTIASNISSTTYTVNNITNNTAHRYTLKTNFNGNLTEASNMAGLTLGTALLNSLQMAANDKMTITEGSELTVTGTMSNENAENLIIEHGAQLIHNSTGVKATVKKTITPYTANDNGWNFIASPVTENLTPSTDNGLIANEYDLYYYDEPEHHWRNYRKSTFDLAYKQGYLYANNTETTLQFEGTLAASNAAVPVTGLSHSAKILNGFNLVGNPFACNAFVNQDFFGVNGNSVAKLAPTDRAITPCEGIFVKADSDAYTVSFTRANGAKANDNGKCLDLVVNQGKANIDRARMRLGEGTNMEKLTLNGDESAQLTVWQDGQDYAVAYADGQSELPLNFKATENGTYSIGIEANSLDLDYLHLIDNLTGIEVDLLSTPSYTFEANKSDYASRFKLMFAPAKEDIAISDHFAFFADGHLHILNQGKAHLQLFDMTGHILRTETLQGSLDKALDLVPGVYVVRLTTEKDTRSMKIVVN